MFDKIKKGTKSESGQSMLEFVLVLPILMVLIAIVLDYGWLFYNQIGMENSARNAARVACVEYSDVCLQENDMPYADARQEFELGNPSDPIATTYISAVGDEALTDTEYKILQEVKRTMPESLKDVHVYIEYTYDKDFNTNGDVNPYNYRNRSKGDVAVYVKATHHTIAPFGIGFGEKEDGMLSMERTLSCKSVYKVEKLSVPVDDTNG